MQNLVLAALNIFSGVRNLINEGFKALISFILDIFSDLNPDILDRIEKAIKEKKDEIIAKVISLLTGLPSIPDISLIIPSLESILDYFKIEIDLDIDLTFENLKSLVFPGIPELSIPQGMLLVFIKIIVSFIEILKDLFTNLSSFLLSLKDFLLLILSGQFVEAIKLIFENIISYIVEKLLEFAPTMINAVSMICSFVKFLEIGTKVFAIIFIGHLLGPGLIFETIAKLILG
jgi:phage-related protein